MPQGPQGPQVLRRLPVRLALALLGGLALWCAFPPVAIGWMAVVGVALTTLALAGATAGRGALLGLVAGLAFFVPLLPWLTVVGTDAWLALSLLCAAWLALMGVGVAWASRLPGAPIWIACLWVAQEALLRGEVKDGEPVLVVRDGEKLIFKQKTPPTAASGVAP